MTDIQVLRVSLYDRPIGSITRLPGDKNLFSFEEDYIRDKFRPTLSLSFKDTLGDLIANVPITRTRLPPFFANLLPEGPFRDYLAERANIDPNREFFFLWMLGQDLPGALTIQAEGNVEAIWQSYIPTWKQTLSAPLRFSLAGVQLKFSAVQKIGRGLLIPPYGMGGTWIVKLPHSIYRNIPENEYSMMELARKIGIDVPATRLIPLEELHGLPQELKHLDHHAFAIERFDRTEQGEKIHIEDFAQVFGVFPENKYKTASYRNLAQVIEKEVGEDGVKEFIRRFVFNVLIGNGDMHLKNWSLIYKDKTRPALAPAYDFVSTILYLPEDRLALNFVDSKDFASLTLAQFKRFSAKALLSEKLVLDTVQETTEAFVKQWKSIGDLPLHNEVRTAIEKHLKTVPFYRGI